MWPLTGTRRIKSWTPGSTVLSTLASQRAGEDRVPTDVRTHALPRRSARPCRLLSVRETRRRRHSGSCRAASTCRWRSRQQPSRWSEQHARVYSRAAARLPRRRAALPLSGRAASRSPLSLFLTFDCLDQQGDATGDMDYRIACSLGLYFKLPARSSRPLCSFAQLVLLRRLTRRPAECYQLSVVTQTVRKHVRQLPTALARNRTRALRPSARRLVRGPRAPFRSYSRRYTPLIATTSIACLQTTHSGTHGLVSPQSTRHARLCPRLGLVRRVSEHTPRSSAHT
jgi:hypothetical protein